jgi:protein kinase A
VDWEGVYERRYRGPIIPPVRYPGDAQCFDIYPEDDQNREVYTDQMAEKYDKYFEDF